MLDVEGLVAAKGQRDTIAVAETHKVTARETLVIDMLGAPQTGGERLNGGPDGL